MVLITWPYFYEAFNYIQHLNIEEWYQMQIEYMLPKKLNI